MKNLPYRAGKSSIQTSSTMNNTKCTKYNHRKNNVVPWKITKFLDGKFAVSRFANKESDLSKGMHMKESNLSVDIWYGKQTGTGV